MYFHLKTTFTIVHQSASRLVNLIIRRFCALRWNIYLPPLRDTIAKRIQEDFFFSPTNVFKILISIFLLVKLRLVHGVVNIITSFNRDGIGKIYIPAGMKVREKKKKLIKYPTKIWFIPTWKIISIYNRNDFISLRVYIVTFMEKNKLDGFWRNKPTHWCNGNRSELNFVRAS